MQVPVRERIPRGFELALAGTGLLWAIAACAIANRSAHGLAGRLQLPGAEALLDALFCIFLLVVGFQLLDWIATRRGELADALPLPLRAGWGREWSVGAAIGWGIGLAAVLPVLLSGHLHGHLGSAGRHPVQFLVNAAALLAFTLTEELVFRGYPFARLVTAIGPSWAAVVSSLGFAVALVWTNPPESLLLALLDGALFGLLLAMSYLRTHALWIGWGVHFALRAVVLLVIGLPAAGHGGLVSVMDSFATGPAWLTGAGFGLGAALLTGPVLLGATGVLYRTTRDYAWRYTFKPIVGAGDEVIVPPPKAHVEMERQAAPAPLVQILATTSKSPTAASHSSSDNPPKS